MRYLGFDKPSFSFKTFGFGSSDDAIKALFAGGKQGVWYDPSDLSTMFKDAAGTQPVTANGDPVGLIKDKSGNGNHATQILSAARPIYRTNGILHWLQFDGVDDKLGTTNILAVAYGYSMIVGLAITGAGGISAATPIFGLAGSAVDYYSVNIRTQSTKQLTVSVRRNYNSPTVVSVGGNSAFAFNENFVVRASMDSEITLSKNSGQLISSVPNPRTSDETFIDMPLILGGENTSSHKFFGAVYARDIADTKKVEQYLAKKSGVTL